MVNFIISEHVKEEMSEIGTDIALFKHRIDPTLSSSIIKQAEAFDFKTSKTFHQGSGALNDHRTSSTFWISGSVEMNDLDQQLVPIFTKGTSDLQVHSAEIGSYIEALKIDNDEGYSLNRYEPGQEYKEHSDDGPEVHRVVSLILYLNNDYEGGELHFRRQNVTIKPEAGDLLLFPSCYTHPHQALPVKSGIKYSIVTWCR